MQPQQINMPPLYMPVGLRSQHRNEIAVISVRKDETLADVAARFGIDDPQEIKELNTLPTDKLRAGQRLRVFVEVKYHKVDPGQNMGDLAEKYLGDRNRTGDLMELNGMKGAGALFPGQLVKIPVEAVIGAGPEPLPRASDRDTLRSRDRAPEVAPPPKLTGEAVPTAALGQSRLDLIESFGFAKGTQEYEAVKANLQEDIKSPLTADEFLQMNGKTYETRFDFAVDFFMELKNRRAAENLELPAIAAYDPKLRFITPGGAKATQLQGTDPSKDPVAGVTVLGKHVYVGIYLVGGPDQVKNADNAALQALGLFQGVAKLFGPGTSIEYYSDNILKDPKEMKGGDVALLLGVGAIGRLRNFVNKYYESRQDGNSAAEFKERAGAYKKQQKAKRKLDAERKASAAAPAYAQLDAQKKQMGVNNPSDIAPGKAEPPKRPVEKGDDGKLQPALTPWDQMLEQLPPPIRALLDFTVVDGKVQFKEDLIKPFGADKTTTFIADPAKTIKLRLGMPAENFAKGMGLIAMGKVEEGMAELFKKFNLGVTAMIADTGERSNLPEGRRQADSSVQRHYSGIPENPTEAQGGKDVIRRKGNPESNEMVDWLTGDDGVVIPLGRRAKPKSTKAAASRESLPINYFIIARFEPANMFENMENPAAGKRSWTVLFGTELETESVSKVVASDYLNKQKIGKKVQDASYALYKLATLPVTPTGLAKAAAQEALGYARDKAIEGVAEGAVDRLLDGAAIAGEVDGDKKQSEKAAADGPEGGTGDLVRSGDEGNGNPWKGKRASKEKHRLLPHETGVGVTTTIRANNMGRVQVENENGELEMRYVMRMDEHTYLMPAHMTPFFDMLVPGVAAQTKPEGSPPAIEPTTDFDAGFLSDIFTGIVNDVITGNYAPSEEEAAQEPDLAE
jgi:LysM repeat protein